MSGRSIILSPALSDAATMSGAATSGDLTIANLQVMRPGQKTRFASLSSMYVEIDLGAAYAITYGFVRSPNVTTAATSRARAATSQANLTASPGYDPGAVDFVTETGGRRHWTYDHHLNLLDSAQSFRWWRFDFTDASNPDGYLDLSRLALGIAIEPEQGIHLNGIGPVQPVVRLLSQGSEVYPAERPSKNTMAFRCHYMSETQALGEMAELQRSRGTTKDLIVVRHVEDTDHIQENTVHGLADEPYLTSFENIPYYDIDFKVTEL